ncbi:putative F-box protein At5g50220 [Sesamum indicum]|uniref:F-box protein At5g50220 n=1 Tax=Sesamum indicum TaxID=4182 RepID=A0A6I9U9E7_SESIN|nr:putative F-box protein At5g50220 [Sesamum indicum]
MGNLATRLSVSPIKESLRNWTSSIMWTLVANKARALGRFVVYRFSQNKQSDESTPILPPEVIIEILSWLPLKSLTKAQLVCKQWRALIHDHYFIQKHMGQNSVVWHWYNVVRTGHISHIDSFSYLHGCDGLLLLRNNSSFKYCIWNPATRRVLELPDPHSGNYGFVFCYVPATGNYRIVAIYNDRENGREGCEVFTPGHSKEWRQITFPCIMTANNGYRFKDNCFIVIKSGEERCERVVSLDMGTETFTVNHLPEGLTCNRTTLWDLDWDGKLALVQIVGKNLQVMELEDYKKHRWCANKKVIPLPSMNKDNVVEPSLFPLLAKQGDIWFWLKGEKIFTYTIKTGQVCDVKQSQTFSLSNKLYPYKPSLVTFEGMVPDTMLEKLRPRLSFE